MRHTPFCQNEFAQAQCKCRGQARTWGRDLEVSNTARTLRTLRGGICVAGLLHLPRCSGIPHPRRTAQSRYAAAILDNFIYVPSSRLTCNRLFWMTRARQLSRPLVADKKGCERQQFPYWQGPRIAGAAIRVANMQSDSEGIRTPAGRAQWISSPSP